MGRGKVLQGEASGLTVTVAEVSRDITVVSAIVRKMSNQLSTTRTLRRVQVPMQSHAQAVVGAEVVDATCEGRLDATAVITWRNKQQSFAATSNHHVYHRCRQATGHKKTVPEVRRRATGLRRLSSARSPSSTTSTVRSIANFRPDLDWDAGRTTDFDGHHRQPKRHRFDRH